MKFIITGGLGFIGHMVVQQLEQQGHRCLIIDNQTDYGFVPANELTYLISQRQQQIKSPVVDIDICDHQRLDQLIGEYAQDADAIIHLASFPRQKVVLQNPRLGSEVMMTGLVNLLELAKSYQIPKFVYISSSMVYGDFSNNVEESSVCNPIGQYAIMKHAGEQLVRDYTRRGCFDHVIVRPSAVYGEQDVNDRVISKFILAALRDQYLRVRGADEILDFTHVSDTAQGIVLASTLSAALNTTFNITRSESTVYILLDAARMVVDMVGSGKIHVEDRDTNFPRRGKLSIDRARSLLGYDPTIDFNLGLEKYIDWFRASEFWQQNI